MENDAWRLYRPVLTIISAVPIAFADVARAESVQTIVMNYQRSYTDGAPIREARRQAKDGAVAKPYFVHPYGERYHSGPSTN